MLVIIGIMVAIFGVAYFAFDSKATPPTKHPLPNEAVLLDRFEHQAHALAACRCELDFAHGDRDAPCATPLP